MSWYLYIAKSSKNKYYVGITTEPARRIKDHNRGKGSLMAKIEGPFKLVYKSDQLPDQSTARKLEIKIKSWTRTKKTQLVTGKIEIPSQFYSKKSIQSQTTPN